MRILISLSLSLFIFCAFPHQFVLGDIDNTKSNKKHFTIMVSERGYNFGEGLTIAQAGLLAANQNANLEGVKNIEYVKTIIDLLTMGPVTGNKLFNSDYTDDLADIVFQHCKSGKITNLLTIRETARYPVVSGEIVRIEGDCIE